jgi:2-C-methyl-D-erythritol 4-phosphate cytidylyltransferase
MKVTAVIAAAGSGKRINTKKQFLEINGTPLLAITASVFDDCQSIDEIIVVVPKEDLTLASDILKNIKKLKMIVPGGESRQDSVFNGIRAVTAESEDDLIVVHDAARPMVTKEIISRAIMEAKVSGAAVVGVPSKDTLKTVSKENVIEETLDRNTIWMIQTPQAFKAKIIKEAYERAQKVNYKATDDSKLVERLSISVKMVMGSYDNIKITTKEDIAIAEAILSGRGK